MWVGLAPPVTAEQFLVGGKPMNVFGYITQGVQYGLGSKSDYDTETGINSLLTNVFIEGDYQPSEKVKFYMSGMFTGDWIYDVKAHEGEWRSKEFDKSRNNLYTDTQYWQLLKEAHVTYSPENFQFRLGKQVVAWGETDGFKLMDQWNPVDQRRGFTDVEFENTVIPIWLVKAEYFPKIQTNWVQDTALEFVFNPNVTFIPNQQYAIWPGNDVAGTWAPNARIDRDLLGPLPPFVGPGAAQIGSAYMMDIDKPDSFSEKGFEYGFRIKGVVKDSIVTLNYFYGRDNAPTVWNPLPAVPDLSDPPSSMLTPEGNLLIHPAFQGRYDLFRFAGGTFTRDIPALKSSALGGVAPVVRLEAFYVFGNTYATTTTTNAGQLVKSDEIRWALGVDWKIKVPFINPSQGITISPQFYMRSILDYPSKYGDAAQLGGIPPIQPKRYLVDHGNMAALDQNNYTTTLMMFTSYWNAKLTPSIFWMRDINRRADLFRLQCIYDHSNNWHYTLGAVFMGGKDAANNGIMNNSFEFFDNKDFLYFKLSYKWG